MLEYFIFYYDIKLWCSLIFKVLNYSIFIMLNTQYLKNYFLIASWYTTLIRVVTFSVSQSSRSIFHVSPPVRESKAVLDSGFHDVDSWFQVLNSDSLSVELGFRIPIVSGFWIPWTVFPVPKPRTQDSGTHKQKFPWYWITEAKLSGLRIPDFRPHMQQSLFFFPKWYNDYKSSSLLTYESTGYH